MSLLVCSRVMMNEVRELRGCEEAAPRCVLLHCVLVHPGKEVWHQCVACADVV